MKILAAAVGLLLVVASAAGAPMTIRVALVEVTRTAEVRGPDIEISPLGARRTDCERCPSRPWHADVVRAVASRGAIEVDGRRANGFRLQASGPLRLNDREYPAALELLPNGDGMAIVNELPLDTYVAGVLRAETGDRWPAEALRAQAIAARTYAAHHRLLNAGKLYDLVASTNHQVYGGRVLMSSPAWTAVQATAGQILLWDGKVFPAFYHAESGGYTEAPQAVFAARNLPALQAVVCPFSAGSPHYYWNLDLKLAELSEILRRNDVGVGAVHAIEVTERAPSLRAIVVTVQGSRGSARLRGNDFRRMIGYETLKSTLFAVAIDGGVAHFSGRGFGHGVGMCQWGAKGMAEQGYTAAQILAYYYPGTVPGSLDGR